MPWSESSSGENLKQSQKFLNVTPTSRTLRRISVGGIMVSIAAFQAVDPGSIPGRRNF